MVCSTTQAAGAQQLPPAGAGGAPTRQHDCPATAHCVLLMQGDQAAELAADVAARARETPPRMEHDTVL